MTSDRSAPRRGYYDFAHVILPTFVERNPAFGALLTDPDLDPSALARFLEIFARAANREATAEERIPIDEIRHEVVRIGARAIGVLTLPTPQRPAEAFMVAVVVTFSAGPQGDLAAVPPAYFALEYSPLRPPPHTLLSRWEGGRHLNFGAGPSPTPAEFAAAIASRLGP